MNKKKPKNKPVCVPDFENRWTEAQLAAWKDIKSDLCNPVYLVAPNHRAEKFLMTDASSYGIGAFLLQRATGRDRRWDPISFASRKLKGTEVNYCVTEQECLAGVWSLKKWRHYLHGGPKFGIVSDHLALNGS